MIWNKETSELGISSEVDNESTILINTHTGWVQGTCG